MAARRVCAAAGDACNRFLGSELPDLYGACVPPSLKEASFVEGRNVAIEYRWAEGRNDRLPGLADDLVRRRVTVMVATTTPAVLAAKAATTTIPIAFLTGTDSVAMGVVASLNRPGGNMTGVSNLSTAMGAKQLELLHAVVPSATVIASLPEVNEHYKQNEHDDEGQGRPV